jgi:alkyl hydroperoxide reductase subunit AhpC
MQPRKQGGLGPDLKLPLVADRTMAISREYGVLIEEEGIALRGLFVVDPKGILRFVAFAFGFSCNGFYAFTFHRQMTVNDLPVGRSVDETLRLIKAFQFAVCFLYAGSVFLIQDAGQIWRSLPSQLD